MKEKMYQKNAKNEALVVVSDDIVNIEYYQNFSSSSSSVLFKKILKEFDLEEVRVNKLVFSKNVIFIGARAFSNKKIKQVEFLGDVKYIGHNAFASCGVEKVKFFENGKNELVLGQNAFLRNNLKKVVLPKNCTRVEEGAFAFNEKLEEIKIPQKLKSEGLKANAFKGNIPKIVVRKSNKKTR